MSQNARRRIGQPVEKLLAEFMREDMSLTAQSLVLDREIPVIKIIKAKNSKKRISQCIMNNHH